MPDSIERTIYKLEIDDSGYIRGVESMSASTKKLVEEQNNANRALKTNEAALKTSGDFLQKSKKDLDDYTGTNERYRKQLEKSFKDAQADQIKLTQLVAESQKRYDQAAAAAEKFNRIAARATELQQQTTGGKIPTGPPPGIPSPVSQFNLSDAVPQTKAAFDQLALSIATAEEHLQSLDVESEEFKQIKPIIDQAKIALQQYGQVTDEVDDKTLSIRGQLRQAKEELVRLEQAGKGASKEYFELEKRTAKLTDAFNDQQARIKILASDTKLLDFGKGAITAATSAFQTYASISILAGGASEELQKKTMQLFAAMQLLQSLEQLSNLTRREGILAVHLQSASQAVYTSVVGASTGALKAFRIALLATGILGAVAAIGFLVSKYLEMTDATKKAAAENKKLKDIIGESKGEYTKAVTEVSKLTNEIKLAKEGFISKKDVVKEYNETIGKTTGQVKNLDEAEQALAKNAEAYIQFTLLKAAANIALGKSAEKAFEIQEELNKGVSIGNTNIEDRGKAFAATKALQDELNKLDPNDKSIKNQEKIEELKAEIIDKSRRAARGRFVKDDEEDKKQFDKIAKDLFDQAAAIGKKFNFNFFGKETKETKEIQNEFARKKAELDARLAELTRKEADNESKIRIEFAARLAKEQLEIEKLLKEKKLTKPQAEILKAENVQINTVEQDKALADFRKKVTDAKNKINDELRDIETKALQDSLNLIQDEFDRRAKLIDANEKIELANAKDATQDRLDSLELDKLLIGEKAYQDAKAVIIATGEQNALNIVAKFGAERQDLSADIFRKSLDNINDVFEEQILQVDEITAGKIQSDKALFNAGAISYDEYQKRITKILKDQKDARDKLRLQELTTELAGINKRLETVTNADEKETLKKRQQGVRNQIAELNSQTNVEDPNKKKVDSLQDYVSAVGDLSNSVIAFWQKANQAESDALDRSISLQEKRVDAAQRIADRGNAQYLKAEEDRLKDLQVKREAAARKQLGIDAALQASQVLVGVTGAISKIASSPFGAETIAEIAIIIGALATGYGIVKSLQGNQPKLAKGELYVKRGNAPAGVDTIPAMLNEGEAVTSAEKNKAYHPVIKAIHEGTVPAEHLNKFVTTYHKVKTVPQVDYRRIKDAAELHITSDGKMAVLMSEHSTLLKENNELQKQILKKNIRVEQTIDKNGVSSMVYDFIEQKRIDSRT